ncbi:hypothetical protein JU57_02035 [Sulfurospirillum sp. SCADC]|nr:hypothetical protein JU57_02035 [Sulfurospirillum sp. SCADC]
MQNVHIFAHKLFENLTLNALNMPFLHITNHESSKNSPLNPTMKYADTFGIHVLSNFLASHNLCIFIRLTF